MTSRPAAPSLKMKASSSPRCWREDASATRIKAQWPHANTSSGSLGTQSPAAWWKCSHGERAAAGVSYCAASVAMVLVNKYALSSFELGSLGPSALLFLQCGICALMVGAAQLLGFIRRQPLGWGVVHAWLPSNCLFVAMLWTSFLALRHLSVPMVTVLKNLSNLFTIAGDYYMYGAVYSAGVWASMAMLGVSTLLGAATDLEFSGPGYAWQLLNCVITAGYSLYVKRAIAKASAQLPRSERCPGGACEGPTSPTSSSWGIHHQQQQAPPLAGKAGADGGLGVGHSLGSEEEGKGSGGCHQLHPSQQQHYHRSAQGSAAGQHYHRCPSSPPPAAATASLLLDSAERGSGNAGGGGGSNLSGCSAGAAGSAAGGCDDGGGGSSHTHAPALSKASMVLLNNSLSLPLMLMPMAATGELSGMVRHPGLRQPGFLFAAAASGAVSCALSFTSLWFLSVGTPTQYSLVGSLNKLPIALLSVALFRDANASSPLNIGSVAMGLVAGAVFVAARQQQQPAGGSSSSSSPASSLSPAGSGELQASGPRAVVLDMKGGGGGGQAAGGPGSAGAGLGGGGGGGQQANGGWLKPAEAVLKSSGSVGAFR